MKEFSTYEEALKYASTMKGWRIEIIKRSEVFFDAVYYIIRCNGEKHLMKNGFVEY